MCTPKSFEQTPATDAAVSPGTAPDLDLVLASQSPARASVLNASGIRFRTIVSGVDEDAALAAAEAERGDPLSPEQTALVLARAKAEAVAALPETRGSFVLGCDSVFEFEGEPYGKPHEPDVAFSRIRRMSGSTGILHTGHWLVDRSETEQAGHESSGAGRIRSAEVTFDVMSDEEITAYVATGEPLEVAGSFTIEGYGAAFIAGIRGESHTVLGLSVNALKDLLEERGRRIAELWRPNT